MAVATGERRIVSVLVADVVDSTAIGEKLGPERSKFLIDEVMRIMSEQVRRFDGTVAQLVGDEMLAFFGVPVSHEDDAERALRAALAIQRALAQYSQEVEAAYGVPLSVRIGVNTGPVVVGVQQDGDDRYDPFNALGDTVNVASRFRRSHQGGRRQRADTSARSRALRARGDGSQDLKGVGKTLETFRSRACGADPSPQLPLVGRDFRADRTRPGHGRAVEGAERSSRLWAGGDQGRRARWEVRDRYGTGRASSRPEGLLRSDLPYGPSATAAGSGRRRRLHPEARSRWS